MRDRDEGFKDMLLLEAVRYIGRVETKYEKREKMQFIATVYIYINVLYKSPARKKALCFYSFLLLGAPLEEKECSFVQHQHLQQQHLALSIISIFFFFFYDKATN